MKKRLVVGISGGSGIPLATELLSQLRKIEEIETHLVYTRGAEITAAQESELSMGEICALADVVYDNKDIGAAIASGTYRTAGMVVVPCSMKTVAGIHSGYTDNLLLRAADVTLKERRKLILVARECPFNTIHLRNLYELSQMSVELLLPMLTYYNHPQTVADCTICIWGGDTPHVGSVVMSTARPSLTGSDVGVTSSVLNGIGHKDEYVARKFAEAAERVYDTSRKPLDGEISTEDFLRPAASENFVRQDVFCLYCRRVWYTIENVQENGLQKPSWKGEIEYERVLYHRRRHSAACKAGHAGGKRKVPAGYRVSWFNRQYGGTAHHCCFQRNE